MCTVCVCVRVWFQGPSSTGRDLEDQKKTDCCLARLARLLGLDAPPRAVKELNAPSASEKKWELNRWIPCHLHTQHISSSSFLVLPTTAGTDRPSSQLF